MIDDSPILSGMLYIPLSMLDEDRLSFLKKYFTLKDYNYFTKEDVVIKGYTLKKPGYIGIPRAAGLKLFSGLKYRDLTASGRTTSHRFNIKPRDDTQRLFMEALLDEASALPTADFVANAKTGSGKTVSGLNLIQNIGKPALVIVPTNNLKKQWLVDAIAKFSSKKWAIAFAGQAQQNVCDFKGKKIVVASLSSIAQRKYSKSFYEYFGVVIFDEVHKCSAPLMSQALMQFPAKVRIGLTATNKKGLAGKVVQWHLGKPKIISKQSVLQATVFLLTLKGFVSLWGNSDTAILHSLALHKRRNEAIAMIVDKRGYARNRNVIVLSDSVKQLQLIQDILIRRGIPSDDVGLYVGQYYKRSNGKFTKQKIKVKDEEYSRIKKNCKVILATYGIFSTGIDEPRLDMGVEAMPRTDMEQSLGRILRQYPGKPTPEWYSLCDKLYDKKTQSRNKFAFLCKKAKNRINNFKRLKTKIVRVRKEINV